MPDKNTDCGSVAYADDYGELASFLEDAAEKLRTLDAIHRNASDAEAFSTLGGVANELVHDGKGDLAESIWSALDKIRAVRNMECRSVSLDLGTLRDVANSLWEETSRMPPRPVRIRNLASCLDKWVKEREHMEQESVAPTNLEISAIGASMHYLVRAGKVSEAVHDAVMRWLVASRSTEAGSMTQGGET